MEHSFILSCESTVDLPYPYVSGRDIPVLFYSYTVDGVTYEDNMDRDPEALARFYDILAQGKIPSTSQLNVAQYEDFLEDLLQKGDVLHVVFGSGMTSSIQNAQIAAETLREKYPDRRLEVVDSTCSCAGYGMLVDYAADLRDQGRTLDEVLTWILENREYIHHQFFSTDLQYYRHSGRISGAAAMLGAVLNLCPIMHLNDEGKIIAYSKVRGKKNAIANTVDTMARRARGGANYDGKCFISHSNCPEVAEETRAAVEARFPHLKGKVLIANIGTIIASHCGPDTVAVYFLGDKRPPGTGA